MIISGLNPEVEDLEKTNLTVPAEAGATSLSVANNQNFAQNDRILVGEMGRERSEIASVTGAVTPGTVLATGSLVFPHNANDPVYRMRFDQMRFYRSTSGINGSYNLVATVAIDVDNAKGETAYDDPTGDASYYYKNSFYNSVSLIESLKSDPMLGGGYTRNSVGALLDAVFREVGDPVNSQMTREEAIDILNEVNDDLISRFKKPFEFLRTSVTSNSTANQSEIAFPADMWKFDHLEYSHNLGGVTDTYSVRVLDPDEFRHRQPNLSPIATDYLSYVWIDETDDKIKFGSPIRTAQTNAFKLFYYKNFSELNSEGDVFETPNPLVYKLYLLARYWRKKGKDDNAFLNLSNFFMNDYNVQVGKLLRSNRRDVGSPQEFKFNPNYGLRGYRRY